MSQSTCIKQHLLTPWEAGGRVLVVCRWQGQARRWPLQGTPLLGLQAHKRLECQAAGQEHGTGGDDVQDGSL